MARAVRAGARLCVALVACIGHQGAARAQDLQLEAEERTPAAAPAGPSRADDPTYDPPEQAAAPEPEPTPEQKEAALPLLAGKNLHDEVPDLTVTTWPPPPRWKVEFGTRYPFQAFGIGVGAEGYLGRIVRLSGFYSFGFGVGTDSIELSNYAEAVIGIRLFGVESTLPITVKAPEEDERVRNPRPSDAPKPGTPLFRASIPSTNALLLELGSMVGNIPRAACSGNCVAPDGGGSFHTVNPLLIYPMAGLRYVLWSAVSSKRRPIANREYLVQAFLYGVYQPLNDAEGQLYWPSSHDPVERNRFGAIGGVHFPLCFKKCLGIGLGGGYLPSPAAVLISVSAGG
jgi:hypothetical protein